MNENSGETPNPLNPNPGVGNGSRPGTLDANPAGPAMPAAGPTNVASVQAAPAMEAVEPLPTEKKKKTGLIVGIIIALFLAIGCGVAAALMVMKPGTGDPVAAAFNKIMSGQAPANVIANGTINVAINNDESPVTNLKLDLDAGVMTNSLINSSAATLTATLKNVGDVTVKLSEMRATDNEIYLKVDGLVDAVTKSGLLQLLLNTSTQNTINDVVDCDTEYGCAVEDEEAILEDDEEEDLEEEVVLDAEEDTSLISQYTTYLSGVLEIVDGEWIKISMDDIEELTEGNASEATECLTNLANDISQNRNVLAEMYNKNAFIGSASGEVTVAKKNDPIYQVAFDQEKLAGFIADLDGSEIMANLNKCQSKNGEGTLSLSDNQEEIIEDLSKLPAIYVEVNGNNDITRLYSTLSSDDFSATVDLGFSYPASINVAEPGEYTGIKDIIQQISTRIYSL